MTAIANRLLIINSTLNYLLGAQLLFLISAGLKQIEKPMIGKILEF